MGTVTALRDGGHSGFNSVAFVAGLLLFLGALVIVVRPIIGWRLTTLGARGRIEGGGELRPSRAGLRSERIAGVAVALMGVAVMVAAAL